MKGYCPLASGSKGNALYFGSGNTKILIDAGLSCKSLETKLLSIGTSMEEIDAVLITHEHTDHIRGLERVCKKWRLPILTNSETAKGIQSVLNGSFTFKIFSTGETFLFGDLEIHPFSIQHDTLDPVAFTIRFDGGKVGICTDLGFVTSLVAAHLLDCNYLYLEANHDVEMVHASSRPPRYKQRVLGRQGHLSNESCASLLKAVYHKNLKHVYLAHLSSECNAPNVALKAVEEVLRDKGVEIAIAHQDRVSDPVLF